MKKIIFCFSLISIFQTSLSQTFQGFYPAGNPIGIEFGSNVAVSNNDVLVSNISMLQDFIGKVYHFELTPSGPQQTDIFYPSDAISTDNFGSSIAIQDDFIAIGSPFHDANFTDSGATYIYKKTNGVWAQFQKITAPDASESDNFGSFVKLYNNQLFISATGDEPAGAPVTEKSGSVYVYKYNGSSWVYSEKIVQANTYSFGSKIEIENNTLVIASIVQNNPENYILHTYTWNNVNWVFTNLLNLTNQQTDINDFAISNQQLYLLEHPSLSMSGDVFIYSQANTVWNEVNSLNIQSNQTEQPLDKIYVFNDKLFIGTQNLFLMPLRFHLIYFKNISGNWAYQNTYSGNGSGYCDDFFGNSLGFNGSTLIVGAKGENTIFNNAGMAYYTDIANLATTDFEKKSITVYPNPTTEKVSISNNFMMPIEKIEVYSISGKLIISENKNLEQVDFTKFANAIYFMKIYFNDATNQVIKIVKI